MSDKGLNVLSLFDGMSCGQIALERAGIKVDNYFAAEIDKYAVTVTQANYPDTKQLGDVTKVKASDLPKIDLLIGGSPCQGFSFAGKQLNFDDPRSMLFFEYVRLLEEIREENPNVLFLLENVRMKQKYQDVISKFLGVEPIFINSELVSAQNRKRFYWTNIPDVGQPEDKGILLKDVLLEGHIADRKKSLAVIASVGRTTTREYFLKNQGGIVFKESELVEDLIKVAEGRTVKKNTKESDAVVNLENLILSDKALEYMDRKVSGGRSHWDFKHHSDVKEDKSKTIVANFLKGVSYNVLKDWNCIRKFHPIECERLQTVPDNYTNHVSNTQRYKMLGNGWTVDVIAHFFKNIDLL